MKDTENSDLVASKKMFIIPKTDRSIHYTFPCSSFSDMSSQHVLNIMDSPKDIAGSSSNCSSNTNSPRFCQTLRSDSFSDPVDKMYFSAGQQHESGILVDLSSPTMDEDTMCDMHRDLFSGSSPDSRDGDDDMVESSEYLRSFSPTLEVKARVQVVERKIQKIEPRPENSKDGLTYFPTVPPSTPVRKVLDINRDVSIAPPKPVVPILPKPSVMQEITRNTFFLTPVGKTRGRPRKTDSETLPEILRDVYVSEDSNGSHGVALPVESVGPSHFAPIVPRLPVGPSIINFDQIRTITRFDNVQVSPPPPSHSDIMKRAPIPREKKRCNPLISLNDSDDEYPRDTLPDREWNQKNQNMGRSKKQKQDKKKETDSPLPGKRGRGRPRKICVERIQCDEEKQLN